MQLNLLYMLEVPLLSLQSSDSSANVFFGIFGECVKSFQIGGQKSQFCWSCDQYSYRYEVKCSWGPGGMEDRILLEFRRSMEDNQRD
jgi:hypothetical protein